MMASSYLTTGNSPEELDKLIQSFEFENQHIVKVIEKENQLLEALDKDISEKKDSIKQLQDSTTQLDEETKRAHKQFIQNRDNCESLRKTASVLLEHEVALMRKLNSVVVTGDQERKDRKNILQHYITIWEDYKAKYDSFPLAKTYKEKTHQLEEAYAKLQYTSQEIQKLKKDILAVKGTDINVYDMKTFFVSLAGVKVDTQKNKMEISVMLEEKKLLEMTLKEIHVRKARAAEEEEKKNKALEEQRQKALLEEAKRRQTLVNLETVPESEGDQGEPHNINIQRSATKPNYMTGGQVPPPATQPRPASNMATCHNQEMSTLAHMCGSEQGPALSNQLQSVTNMRQIPPQPIVRSVPVPEAVRPVNRPQTPTPTATSQRSQTNQPGRTPLVNPAPMRYTFTGGNRGASMPQRVQVPSYMIQQPANQSTNISGALTKQVLSGRQLSQGRQSAAPTFKHPSQLETPIARVSPPRSTQTNSQQGQSIYLPSDPQTQSVPNSLAQSRNQKSQQEKPAQNTQSGSLTGPSAYSYLPQSANRPLPQGYPQSGTRQAPPVCTTKLQPTPVSQSQTQAPQWLPCTAQPVSMTIPTSTPNTPARQTTTPSDATKKTPEHLRCSSEPGTPGKDSPFDLEKHLERVRLLTKSPGGPEFITRPMFEPEQAVNMPTVAKETVKPVEDSPFMQSFFPDGRGDGNPFQSNFSSPVLGTTSGKSLFGNPGSALQEATGGSFFGNPASPDPSSGQSQGGMSFNFSGGGNTGQAGGMFALFGGPGETQSAATENTADNFSFNFGGSGATSPTVNSASGFSLF